MSCAPQPARDVDRYTDALALADSDPEAAMSVCRQILDEQLGPECAQVVALRAPKSFGGAGRWCPEVPEGIWRDECWFMSAEASRKAGQTRYAAELCLKSGRFVDDCAQHLWQGEVHELIAGLGPQGFADRLPEAEALYQEWAPLLHANTDLSTRFWDKFFGNGFEAQGGVDLAWCEGLAARGEACVAAGLAYLERDLGPKLSQARSTEAFCALEDPDAIAISAWFPNRPDPRLDRVIRDRHAELCAVSAGGPPATP